jgi:Ser/Thr protein kinase RdoA (MazF antagonist)
VGRLLYPVFYIPSWVWRGAIEDAIDRARVANTFHSSDFIRETELELLRTACRSGRLRLLWLPINGALPAAPEQALQALHDPNRPLASLPEIAARDAMAAISRDIEHAFYAMVAAVSD